MDLDLPNRNSRSDSRVRLVALKLGPAVKHGRHPTIGTDEYSPNLATSRKRWGLGIKPAASACASGSRKSARGWSHGLNLSISAAISSSLDFSAAPNSWAR